MNENLTSSKYFIKEINSVWRKALHLAQKEEIPKDYIWPSDDEFTQFSFLDKGCIRVEGFNSHGIRRIYKFVESGCIFRELPLFQSSSSIYGSLVAIEPCVVYNFSRSLLSDKKFLAEYPELVMNLIDAIAKKAVTAYEALGDGNNTDICQVVCQFFVTLADKAGENIFEPKISQSDLATIFGIHRATLCKAIKDLREENVIGTFSRKKLEILDKEKLIKYAEGCE